MIDLDALQAQRSISSVGIGLRASHYQHILTHEPTTPWFEVMTDNYMGQGGQPHDYLQRIRERYPITFHGVGLSLGSVDPLSSQYLKRLKELIAQYQPAWVSEHLCWCGVDGKQSNDLLPLPYTEEAVHWLVQRIDQVQQALGQALVIENVSSYLEFEHSVMPEWDFVQSIVDESGCGLLLDVNNVYVSSKNHGFDPMDYLNRIRPESVVECHLAGYEDCGTHLLDTHGARVHEPVWALYEQTVARFGQVPTLIEWDNAIPEFSVLEEEAEKAAGILHRESSHAVA